MIPSLTAPSHPSVFGRNISQSRVTLDPNLSFLENLKKLGLFDDQYNLLFTPSKIPPISQHGQKRWNDLMKCCTGKVLLEEYITGFSKTLSEKGIKIDSYLRGGYASYVACIPEYFEFLIVEFLASKNLPKNLFTKELKELKNLEALNKPPNDVDLFDHVLTDGIPPTALELYHIEFLKCQSIQFLKKLIPKTSSLFPYKEDYVLFITEGENFNIDRIIGRLHHPYLFVRDDIRIKVQKEKLVPESSRDFWQMVLERTLKVVRTESWHEKDFRAGLAALQLMQEEHILIQDACPLMRIFRYAVSTGSEKIYTGAIDRAKLHCKNPYDFLLSVLIAYSHAAPSSNIQILKDAIGEIPPLASLYKLALLLTCYRSDTYRAEWDPSGLLILYWKGHKIFFPKNFALRSNEKPFYSTDKWELVSKSQLDPEVLDGDLSPLERVLFELTLQKPMTPLSESMKNVLVEYLIEDNTVALADRFLPWLSAGKGLVGWTKAFLNYSIRHGLKLWNALKPEEKLAGIGEIVTQLGQPIYSYSLLGDAPTPKELRLRLLKVILKNPSLKPDLAEKILEELIEENSLPSQEQIEVYYQNSKNVKRLIWWISLNQEGASSLFQKYKNDIKPQSETYIKFIKQFQCESLAKEWINSFPQKDRLNQTLLSFADSGHVILDSICSLPGLKEKELLEALYLCGRPVFKDRPANRLLEFLNLDFSDEIKEEIFKTLVQTPCDKKELILLQRSMTLKFIPYCLESPVFLSIALNHLIHLNKTKNLDDQLWLQALDAAFKHPETLHELIPFFRNRKWVRSVYGKDTETKTREWGTEALKQKNINRAEVNEILSLNQLIFTPLANLRNFIETLTSQRLMRDDMLKPNFDGLVSTFITTMNNEAQEKLYCLDILIRLLKLAMKAGVCSFEDLHILKDLSCIPVITFEDDAYFPFFHLIQHLPFFDFGSLELYNEWNGKRRELLQSWMELPAIDVHSVGFEIITLKESHVLKILPYELAAASFEYSYRYKLITEQYIEKKVSKEEFQEEVRSLSHSSASIFGTEDLLLFEDPCLICIQDLSFILKEKNKRIRVYEAFNFLLQSQKKSPLIQDQMKYLEIRQNVEEWILSNTKLLENGKIGYCEYLRVILLYLESIANTRPLQCLDIPDPISDAFELDSIELIERIDLQGIWVQILSKSDYIFVSLLLQKIKGYMFHEKRQMIEKDSMIYLLKRTDLLQKIYKLLSVEVRATEISMITEAASHFLSKDNQDNLIQYMQKSLGMFIKTHKK